MSFKKILLFVICCFHSCFCVAITTDLWSRPKVQNLIRLKVCPAQNNVLVNFNQSRDSDHLIYSLHRRHQSMAVARINREITSLQLNWTTPLPQGTTVPVCSATEDEWNTFVESEDQELKSTHMEWCDGTILIVELPMDEHEIFCHQFCLNFLQNNIIISRHLQGYRAAFARTVRPRLEPDESYGPKAGPLPAGLQTHRDWKTLKVEIGFSRRWGDTPGQLDWKANQWTTFVGVRYVLCVAIWPNLARAEYKLYTVQGLNIRLPQQNPIPVVAPRTLVSFDSRVLLGLQPADILPVGFPDPLTLDLYQILEEGRDMFP